MGFEVRIATITDIDMVQRLIAASVRGLQTEYTEAEREAALRTIFTVDSRLIADGTYFVAFSGDTLAGCGGWSFRRTLYGGDSQVEKADQGTLDASVDAAKIRAIFVHPDFARMGLGSVILGVAEDAARQAGFLRTEMGSTLAGVALYGSKGYCEVERVMVPVGGGHTVTVVRMERALPVLPA